MSCILGHLMFPTGVGNSPITATDATVAPQQSIEFLRALAAQLQNAQNAQAQQTTQLMQNFSQVQPTAAHVAQQMQAAAQHAQSASVLQQLQVNNHLRSQSQQIAQQHQQHVEAHQQQAQAIIQAHASFALQQQHAALSRASQSQSVTATSTHSSGTSASSMGQRHIEESHRRPSLMSNFFPQPVLQNSNVNQQPSIVKDDKAQLCVDTGVPSGTAHGITKAEPSPGGATPQSTEKDSEEQAEKKAMSDRLEAIEKERKQADQQVEALIKRCERYRNVKKESEQDIKLEPINGEAEETENMPLWEKIIMENKKKMVEARTKNPFLSNLPPMDVLPLYHEPRDAPGMAELLERHKEFRPQLIQMLVEKKRAEDASNRCTLEKYNILLKEWTKKVEKWENSPKKLVRDVKHREIFERTFPELKKQREDKERSGRNERISLRGHDTADFLTVPGERDDDDRKMRNAIAIPPLLLDESSRRRGFFDNKHAIIKDAALENRKGMESFIATWSEEERVLFRSRLSAVGKNYANIAMYLEKKSVKDCVLYYYLSKKRENYKVLFPKRKRKVAKSYKPPIMPTAEELMMYQLVPQDASVQTQPNAPLQENRCINCQLRIDPAMNPGRVLTRASYEMYGIDSKKQGADVKICTKCKDLVLKNRNSGRCMVKACASGRRKAKATKPMPAKWRQMDDRQRAFLLAHMGIPREILKCCGPCFKRIGKKLDLLFSGDLNEEMEKFEEEAQQVWQNDEITRLLNLVSDLGTDWNMVSEQMDGRSADECRTQYETGRKDEEEDEEEEEEGDTEKGERPDDEVTMEEETQDIPEATVPEIEMEDTTFSTSDNVIPPPPSSPVETEVEADRTQSENPVAPADQAPMIITSLPDGAPTVKGSITAGTPFRPPSVSIIEPSASVPVSTPVSQSLTAMTTTGNTVASARNTPQPQQSSAQNVASVDSAMLLQIQIHQLLGGSDENRSRAVVEQLAAGLQQQQRQYQQLAQISQLLSQQPQIEQLLIPYSMCTEAELIRLSTAPTEPVHVRMLAEVMLQKKQRETTAQAIQIRQQHSQNLLVQLQANQLQQHRQQEQQRLQQQEQQRQLQEKQRQQQLLQAQEQQRREQQQQVKDKMEQLKNGENALVTYEKLLISLANRVKDINQTLTSVELTPFQRSQLAMEFQQTSAQYNNAQTNYLPLKQQVHQLRLTLAGLGILPNATGTSMSGITAGSSNSALISGATGMPLSGPSTSTRSEEIRPAQLLLSPDEQRLREEIDKNDSEIADVEKNLRRYEDEERNYQKMKMNAEQMMTSAFRINSKDQDIKAKRELNTAQDNLRIVEHTRITFQKRLESLKERREAFVTQLRTLRDSGVIVGGSSHPLSKGAVKEFHPHKAVVQQQQSYQPVTSSAINAHQQLQFQLHQQQQQQQQQQKNPIGIRQPTTENKQSINLQTTWSVASTSKENTSWLDMSRSEHKKSFNNILDKVVQEELTTTHSVQNVSHSLATPNQEMKRKSGLETICLPTVQSAARHPQRRPASPAVTAIGTQRSNVSSRSILGIPTPFVVSTAIESSQSQVSPRPTVPASPQVQFMNTLAFPTKENVKVQSEVPSATVAPQRSEVPSAVVQPITVSSAHSSNVSTIQGFQVPTSNGSQLLPPSTLPFTLPQSLVLASAPTYEPLSPEDEAAGSPGPVPARTEPSITTCGAQASNSRMFSVLDFDWPVSSSVPSSSAPVHPVPDILRGAPEGSAAAKPAFEPLSDDED